MEVINYSPAYGDQQWKTTYYAKLTIIGGNILKKYETVQTDVGSLVCITIHVLQYIFRYVLIIKQLMFVPLKQCLK